MSDYDWQLPEGWKWPETRTRCARCGMEDHTIEDCHAWCSHAPGQPCPPPEEPCTTTTP